LAVQVEESVRTYGKFLRLSSMVMFGGVNINPQISRLKRPLDILVATPGRLLDHVSQKTIDLSAIEYLLLDEADRMLDMGFIRDILQIISLVTEQRQHLLFSGTFSDEIKDLASGMFNDPVHVEAAQRITTSDLVSQSVQLVHRRDKSDLVIYLVQTH